MQLWMHQRRKYRQWYSRYGWFTDMVQGTNVFSGTQTGCQCKQIFTRPRVGVTKLNSSVPFSLGFHHCEYRDCTFRNVIFLLLHCYEISLSWTPKNSVGDRSTQARAMAWRRQVTTQYPGQRWSRSLSTYGVTEPQSQLVGPSQGGPGDDLKMQFSIMFTIDRFR